MTHLVIGCLEALATITFILVNQVLTFEQAQNNFHNRFPQQVDGSYLKYLKFVL